MRAVVRLAALLFALPLLGDTRPEARWGHAFVYDEARDEILLFGGASTRHLYRDDTWTWKDGIWTRHEVSSPPARGFPGAAFDQTRGTVVIHGGRASDGSTLSDSWEWNGAEWRHLAESSWKADHHALVFDRERRMLVGFGGWSGSAVLGETWTFDGNAWKLLPGGGPAPRSAFGMAWDPRAKRVVLYGGLWISGQYADTFEWDGKWTALTGPYDDSSLDHHSLAWDATRGRLLLFGGKNYRGEMSGRTRALEAGRWTALQVDGPPQRHSTPLALHGKRGTTLLFGGKEYRGEEQLPLGDLWEWDGSRWRELSPAVTDSAAIEPRATGAFFALNVPDLEASVAWYSEALGLEVTKRVPARDGIAVAVLEGWGLIVELIEQSGASGRVSASSPAHGLFKAGVLVDDFDAMLRRLEARGVEIAFGPFPPREGQRANVIVRDNAGNLIQFFGH